MELSGLGVFVNHVLCRFTSFSFLYAKFEISNPSQNGTVNPSVYVGLVYGDGSSLFHVQSNQTFYMEYQKATSKRSNPKINLLIKEHGDLITVNDLRISGGMIPAIDLRGTIRGVTKFTLSTSRVCQVSKTGSITVAIHRENSSAVAINLGMLSLEYDSKLVFTDSGELDIGYFTLRQKTLMSAKYFNIKSTAIDIEGEGRITTSARSEDPGLGTGNDTQRVGSGGGHGGYGGGYEVNGGGKPYGSYSVPTHPGSKGGGIQGGAGGSIIKVCRKLWRKALDIK